jgi:hypothetical protein
MEVEDKVLDGEPVLLLPLGHLAFQFILVLDRRLLFLSWGWPWESVLIGC